MRTKFLSVILLTIFTMVSLSSVAMAEYTGTNTTTNEQATEMVKARLERDAKQCQTITIFAGKIQTQQSKRLSNIQSKLDQLSEKISDLQSERKNKLTELRAKWDARRQENFAKLRAKATTSEQKQAIEEYIDTISKAITTRRTANDAAFTIFRSDLAAIKSQINQIVDIIIKTNSSEIQTAIIQAKKATCLNEQDSTNTKKTLEAALKSSRQSVAQSRQNDKDSRSILIKAAVDKRKTAVKANNEAFKTTAQEARQKLLTSFGDQKTKVE